jgi:gag-polypeptide of LTR copia-type
MTSLGIQSSILEQVVKLNGDNWHIWQSQSMMAFQSNESDEIVAGMEKEPSANKADELRDWKRKNKLAVTYMWSRIEPEWQHLVLGETGGSIAFAKLKRQFEVSNFSHRVALRKAFYGAIHDMSQPIEIYIRSVVDAKSQLEAIGVKVNDDALKDVILMNLNDSFSSVCTSLLTQPIEPSFDTIRSVLGSSTHIVHPRIPIKPEEFAMAAKSGQRRGGRKEMRSPGCGDSSENWRDRSAGGGIKDEKGYRWCDTTNDHHCHRCGHTGHNTARCTADMPPEVKARILNNDCTMHVSRCTSFIQSCSHSWSSSPVDSHLISFTSKTNNKDTYYGAGRNDRIVFEKCL